MENVFEFGNIFFDVNLFEIFYPPWEIFFRGEKMRGKKYGEFVQIFF